MLMTDIPSPLGDPAAAYEQYFVPILFRPGAQVLLDHARLQRGEHLLDVACGTGIVARMAAPLISPKGSITAVDINPQMLAIGQAATENSPNHAKIEWREGSAMLLPFQQLSFDVVLCQQGLQFFANIPRALGEMWRVLKPGGRVLLSVNQSLVDNPIFASINAIFHRHLEVPVLADGFHWKSSQSLDDLLQRAGFREISVEVVQVPVHTRSVDDFVRGMLTAATTIIPALASRQQSEQSDLLQRISSDMHDVLSPYATHTGLNFSVNVYLARATTA
jgi:ubiquinone/menaquinone biosynthesis C-methylase UbiE